MSKRCKTCRGSGFIFESIVFPSFKNQDSFPTLKSKGLKTTCPKCYGKGAK